MDVNISSAERETAEMESTDLSGLSLLVFQIFYFFFFCFVRFMKLVFGSVEIMQSLCYFSP